MNNKKYASKFNIKIITLVDNSLKKCHGSNIKLALMLTLITGHKRCVFCYTKATILKECMISMVLDHMMKPNNS